MSEKTDDAVTVEKSLMQVNKTLHAKVRAVADRRGLSISEAADKYCGPGIEREYRKVVKEMHDEVYGPELGTPAGA